MNRPYQLREEESLGFRDLPVLRSARRSETSRAAWFLLGVPVGAVLTLAMHLLK